MNTQWLTTLFTNVRAQVEESLHQRGLRLDPVDLAALLEEVSPRASKKFLSYALDILKPFTQGMGLTVKTLTETQIEVHLPLRPHNLTAQNEFHEGVLLGAAIETVKLIWGRHAPLGQFRLFTTEAELITPDPISQKVVFKLELDDQTRERCLSDLRNQKHSQYEQQVLIFDEQQKSLGRVNLQVHLAHQPLLTS